MIKWTLVPTEFLYVCYFFASARSLYTLRNRPTTTGTTYTHTHKHIHTCTHAHMHMRTHAHISRPFEELLWDDLKDERAIDELALEKEVCWRLSNGVMVPYGWADFTEGSLLKAK